MLILNVDYLDEEHNKIVSELNSFQSILENDVSEKELFDLISEVSFSIGIHVVIHFNDEEKYMKSINYSGLNEHKLIHEKIYEEYTNLIQNVNNKEFKIETIKNIVNSFKEDIIKHIEEEDLKFKL